MLVSIFQWVILGEIREAKEEVLAKAEEFEDKAEELGEEAKEFAKDHRVPVPQMKLPCTSPQFGGEADLSKCISIFFFQIKSKP